jgi:dTDP-D-glucose 4,6-dehydratase
MIKRILNWEPSTSFREGLAKTYAWIEQQYQDRKAGKVTVRENYQAAGAHAPATGH